MAEKTLSATTETNPNQPQEAPSREKRGVVAVIARDGRLLLIRRSGQVVAPGKYCFPGGAVEAGETEEQALVRELREELGVTISPISRIWESSTEWGVHLSWWESRLESDAHLRPSATEVETVLWCTIPEILELPDLLSSNRQFLEKVVAGEIKLNLDQ